MECLYGQDVVLDSHRAWQTPYGAFKNLRATSHCQMSQGRHASTSYSFADSTKSLATQKPAMTAAQNIVMFISLFCHRVCLVLTEDLSTVTWQRPFSDFRNKTDLPAVWTRPMTRYTIGRDAADRDLSFVAAGDHYVHAGTQSRSSPAIFCASVHNLIQTLKADQSKVYLFVRTCIMLSNVLITASKFICK